MKKLFQAIRHYDLDAVKAVLQKHPAALDEAAVPPPKKDAGQSPLQVAVKISAFEIAAYLIEQGADVNFMEAEGTDTSSRCPLLQDAVGNVLFQLCCSELMPAEEVTQRIADSVTALEIVRALLERGADVRRLADNGMDALDSCVHDAERILDNPAAYPHTQKAAEERFWQLLDLLRAHGADFSAWAGRSHYPGADEPEFCNRFLFLDDFIPNGKADAAAHTRAVMQRYFKANHISY